MKSPVIKKLFPHIIALLLFFVVSVAYFSPVLEGKELFQSDVMHWKGMSKEIRDFKEETGEHTLWTNSMFSGMPSYLISNPPSTNLLLRLHKVLNLNFFKPVNYLFVLMVGFYIALLLFGVNPWLSIVGAIGFGLSTNFVLLIQTGHVTKVSAIGYMVPVIAGVYAAYRGKMLLGSIIVGIFLSIHLAVNHLQMTYYALMIILLLGLVELIIAIREKKILPFLKITGVLVIVAFLAVSTNITNFLLTHEYSEYSTRGESELTDNQENRTTGLDKDYVTAWSYGIGETFTLLIPNFYGGANGMEVGENSASYEFFEQIQGAQYARNVIKSLPMYWGPQPFTGGPVYAGAIIFFLFIFGIFLIKSTVKWWLLGISILAVMLSWGRNFSGLTNLFLDYVPYYNKFRDVTMILIIVQITIPLLGILALQKILDENIEQKSFLKAFKYTVYGTVGVTLFFILFPGAFFDFSAPVDQQYINQGATAFVDALVADRKMLLRNDAIRSFIFCVFAVGSIWAFHKKKITKNIAIAAIGILIVIDLWTVDKRYVDNDSFRPKKGNEEAYQPLQADLEIMSDTSLYFRVFDLTADPFRSARASYFHSSLGGYHGAKMGRYQEIIERHLSRNNIDVINMLNTKYFIIPGDNSPPQARMNTGALDNAWFVSSYRIVKNADEEIKALNNFDPSSEAIIDERFIQHLDGFEFRQDSTAQIQLTDYKPNYLQYTSQAGSDQLAVFSDIYYEKGWKAFIDNEPAEHFRVNYILRSMIIPAGKHTIEFKFESDTYTTGRTIALISSIILVLASLFVIGFEIRKIWLKEVTQSA